ncbi:sensor histidine kinase [Paenibacillus thalictri]|uniref:histidine kinase n=1 Tax=Paenibacillus thalictri TaxID=2527873 RepID=A0A4V2J491_9BACL|nr:histidine kinase [Paenibacillus thalictri]TBL78511.1 HAMP domain-containing protein [Paenibacillus thalictri]
MLRLSKVTSFRQKLLASSFLCLIIPMVIVVVVSNYATKDVFKEQAIANTEQSLLILDTYIANLINNLISVTNAIQFDNEVKSILDDESAEQDATKRFYNMKKMNEKFASVVTASSNPLYLAVISTSGTAFSNYSYIQDYDPINFTRMDWFRQLEHMDALETYWVGTQKNYIASSANKSPYLITIARTMKYSSVTSGYMVASIYESDVNNIFRSYSNSQEIMLVNGEGTVLSHTNRDKIGSVFPYMNEIDGGTASIVHYENNNLLLVKRKLAFSDWYLVSLTPYKEAIDNISRVHRNVLLLTITCFALFLIILLYLLNQMTKPFKLLGKVVTKVRSGQLTFRSNITSNDEIGRFAQSFDQMLDRIEQMIGQITLEQTRKRAAELEMLQAQVNPHFLFNILNSTRMKILMKGDEENAELLGSLSALLRMTINRSNEYIPLHDELELIASYVKLVNLRHKEQISLELEPASNTLFEEIPRFSIQPFVENAILHGLANRVGVIRVSSRMETGRLILTVEDNGTGMQPEKLGQLLQKLRSNDEGDDTPANHGGISGIGLKNAYERLKLTYGPLFDMSIASENNVGTIITLFIPRECFKEVRSDV